MGKRLTPVEQIAREICWAEFQMPQLVGKTKAAYWLSLSATIQQRYVDEAERVIWLSRKLGWHLFMMLIDHVPEIKPCLSA